MNRAERRRLMKENQKQAKRVGINPNELISIKNDERGKATDRAFTLLLAFSAMTINDKLDIIQKSENPPEAMTDELLEMYDSFQRGFYTIDDAKQVLKEECGIVIEGVQTLEEKRKERCDYCVTLEEHLTGASPRKKYVYCPMCGRKLIKCISIKK